MKIYAIAVCALLAGCQSAPPSAQVTTKATTKRTLAADEIAIVQKGVRESLKDPNSAMFGSVTAAQEDKNSSWVCGTVNARNSFGGYTGPKPFMGMLVHMDGGKAVRMFNVTSMGGTESATYATMEMCRRYGVI